MSLYVCISHDSSVVEWQELYLTAKQLILKRQYYTQWLIYSSVDVSFETNGQTSIEFAMSHYYFMMSDTKKKYVSIVIVR